MMNGCHEDHQGGQSAIMASLDQVVHSADKVESSRNAATFITTPLQQKSLPDVLSSELQSLSLVADRDNNRLSFLLLDVEDNLSGIIP